MDCETLASLNTIFHPQIKAHSEALLPPVYQLGPLHLLGCGHRGVQARVHGVARLQLHLQQPNNGISWSDVMVNI